MKYKVTLKGRTYEVEVEAGEAILLTHLKADGMQSLNAAVFGYQIFNFQHCRRLLPGRPG